MLPEQPSSLQIEIIFSKANWKNRKNTIDNIVCVAHMST